MENILDNLEQPIDLLKYRRSLLPWWIKGFSWLFMIFGGFSIAAIVPGIYGIPIELSFYALESQTVLDLKGAIVGSVYLLSGIVGYGLFFGKNWAVNLGLALCVAHALLLVSIIAYPGLSSGPKIRLEFILVIPFFIKLLKLKQVWQAPQNNVPTV